MKPSQVYLHYSHNRRWQGHASTNFVFTLVIVKIVGFIKTSLLAVSVKVTIEAIVFTMFQFFRLNRPKLLHNPTAVKCLVVVPQSSRVKQQLCLSEANRGLAATELTGYHK